MPGSPTPVSPTAIVQAPLALVHVTARRRGRRASTCAGSRGSWLTQSQHWQHAVCPELPVHSQRRAAREAAREQVVVAEAVGLRAPVSTTAGRQTSTASAAGDARQARALQRPAPAPPARGSARATPIAAATARYGIAGMKCFTPPKIGVDGTASSASGPRVCVARNAPGARSTSAPGRSQLGARSRGAGRRLRGGPAVELDRLVPSAPRAAAPTDADRPPAPASSPARSGWSRRTGRRADQLVARWSSAGCSSSGPGTRSCSARAAGGG